MKEYRIEITDAICPGQSDVRLGLPGRSLRFRRLAQNQEPILTFDGVLLSDDLARALAASGYDLTPDPLGASKQTAKPAKARRERSRGDNV